MRAYLKDRGTGLEKGKVAEAARKVAGPVIEGMGYELVDVHFVFESRRWYLRFFIDKPGGINVSDCEIVSREIDTLIEVEDFIPGPYMLEVSSPGLDRPLFRSADFIRFEGALAKVRTKVLVGGQKVFLGRIQGPDEKGFNITTSDKKTYYIEYGQVEKARLEVEF